MKKKKIPESVRLLVLEESGYQCAFCGHRDGLNLTAHHVKLEKEGGKTDFYNLIALCYNCHHRVDETKSIPRKEIRRLKRHFVHQRLTQAGVNALIIDYKNPFGVIATPFSITHLVEENLLKHEETQMSYVDKDGEIEATALYRITEKGKELAEMWIFRTNKYIKRP